MFRKFLIVTLAAVLALVTACQGKGSKGSAGSDAGIMIGVSFYALSGEFNTGLRNAMEAYLKDNNITSKQVSINVLDAQGDANKQNSQVETLISDKYNAIVMCSGDAEAQAQVTIASVKAGIPMIELCTSTKATDVRTAYVGSSDIVSGRMLMQQLGEVSGGKGKLVALHGPTGISAAVYREKGMYEIIQENGWNYDIVAEKVCNWSREQAMSTIENYLNSGLDFDIIFAENDEMAVGALAAIENSGTNRKIYLGGIDAIPDAVQAVLEGRMDCTVFQDAEGQGRTAMEVAIKVAKGESIDKMYDIPFQMVLKDNARDFLPKK